ncbi:GYD domain-containing protein [Micromonospora sp. WMMA1363]|uniref:GYD domain-containing protein n=1 Tax=Micromonospora sp. WMMA1363 TaxID=3053985 RepID=UPI00259D26EE|nr:GYD domain-containing protein [Micromonospora sp. WMMA1363]MDM4721493.1 GYD domain-containing protein [Micromonospora sp. WMMA1363]
MRFLVMATYTTQGIGGLAKEGGTRRAEVVQALIENSGGQVEALYFSFGEHDLYVLCELPDNMTAAALGIAVRAAGGVDTVMIPLLTSEDIDEAAQVPIAYRAPGR